MPVIRPDFARAGLAASGSSEAFLNRLQVLADATAGAGQPRFAPATLRYLERALTARGADLRDAVYQLAHLLAAAARIAPSGRALDAVFGHDGPVRAGALARHLADLAGGVEDVAVTAEAVEIAFRGGERYAIARPRLPLLVALLDFLLTAADAPEDMTATLDQVAAIEADPREHDTLRRASNALAAALNARLDAMLRGRAERDRFEALAGFLDAQAEAGDGHWRIDDDTILAFWCAHAAAPQPGADFRQFRTVHRMFVALVLALRAGEDWQRLHRAPPADDTGQVLDIPDGAAPETAEGAEAGPLDRLASPPCDRVKFLTGAELSALQLPVRLWGAVQDFPVSVLRSEAMGAVQNAIANALRFGRPVAGFVALEEVPGDYAAARAARDRVTAHLRRMLYAAVHVSAERRGIRLPEQKAAEARKAFRGVRRQGFAEALTDPAAGAAFDAAVTPLSDLSGLMAGLARAMPGDEAALFAADLPVFRRAFADLYAQEG